MTGFLSRGPSPPTYAPARTRSPKMLPLTTRRPRLPPGFIGELVHKKIAHDARPTREPLNASPVFKDNHEHRAGVDGRRVTRGRSQKNFLLAHGGAGRQSPQMALAATYSPRAPLPGPHQLSRTVASLLPRKPFSGTTSLTPSFHDASGISNAVTLSFCRPG